MSEICRTLRELASKLCVLCCISGTVTQWELIMQNMKYEKVERNPVDGMFKLVLWWYEACRGGSMGQG